MDYESIAHEAVGRMGYSTSKSMRPKGLIVLVKGQNKDLQIKLLMKSFDIIAKRGSLLFLSAILSLLVGYHK